MAFTKILGPGIHTEADLDVDDILAGIVTATRFEGDGSQLTGLPGGLGTALSSDSTSPLSAIYTNDRVLSIGATITIDVPSSSSGAYTQYTDIVVDADADLIVADGDDFIPDILGLSVPGSAELLPGAGGRVRADQFTNKAGTGAPSFPKGITADGTSTFAGSVGFSTTGAITLPRGTTAQRPSSPVNGMLRYNTSIEAAEQYRNGAWVSIDVAPVINSVSPTSFNGVAGTSFTIKGSGFQSTDTVKFVKADGTSNTAGTVTFVGVTTLTATSPVNYGAADDPITIQVVTQSGLTVTASQTVSTGGSPTWTTSAGTLNTINDKYGTYTGIATLSATDPEGQTVSYSVSSGSLPAGTSLNSSSGVISGDPTDLSASTATSTFTAAASDGVNSTTREFSIVVNAAKDGTENFRAALNGADIKALNPSASDGTYWINPYTTESYANPQQYTVDMANDGWITADLSDMATNLNSHISYTSSAGNSVINWNSTISSYLWIGSANSGNNSNNWNAYMSDRELMGRALEKTAWRDWDVSFRLSNGWGWGEFKLVTPAALTGTFTDDAATNGGAFEIASTGQAAVSVRNNSSNNLNQAVFRWWNGSADTDTAFHDASGNSDGTTYRLLLESGVAKYYINGSLTQTSDLTNNSTYSNTPVTSSTKWLFFNQHQSVSWMAISSLKVRNPAT